MNTRIKAQIVFRECSKATQGLDYDPVEPIERAIIVARQQAFDEAIEICREVMNAPDATIQAHDSACKECIQAITERKGKVSF